jgi:hypothetical protein
MNEFRRESYWAPFEKIQYLGAGDGKKHPKANEASRILAGLEML